MPLCATVGSGCLPDIDTDTETSGMTATDLEAVDQTASRSRVAAQAVCVAYCRIHLLPFPPPVRWNQSASEAFTCPQRATPSR
jgi:hypothetical protein